MSKNIFHNVKITAIKTVVQKDFINIDDEIEYYDNSEKKLNRVKNIIVNLCLLQKCNINLFLL